MIRRLLAALFGHRDRIRAALRRGLWRINGYEVIETRETSPRLPDHLPAGRK